MNGRHAGYRSYLLRVWNPDAGETHATIQEVATGRCQAFTSLDELRSWLEEDARKGPERRVTDGDHRLR